MPQLSTPFLLLQNVLSHHDIKALRETYAKHAPLNKLPCYAFIDCLQSPVQKKIADLVANAVSCHSYYLNDFFFYTSNSFSTPWHVDTELYLFQNAINAWILLEPNIISNPLGFIDSFNSPHSDTIYHSVEEDGDDYLFVDYVNSDLMAVCKQDIEFNHITTPDVNVGDILLLDPLRFHRTNTTVEKGACVFKYVYSASSNLIRANHLPEIMWPELSLYKRLYDPSQSWSHFLSLIKHEIFTKFETSPLISGFYPANFPYLIQKASELA